MTLLWPLTTPHPEGCNHDSSMLKWSTPSVDRTQHSHSQYLHPSQVDISAAIVFSQGQPNPVQPQEQPLQGGQQLAQAVRLKPTIGTKGPTTAEPCTVVSHGPSGCGLNGSGETSQGWHQSQQERSRILPHGRAPDQASSPLWWLHNQAVRGCLRNVSLTIHYSNTMAYIAPETASYSQRAR